MTVEFLGKDPESEDGRSPTVWSLDNGDFVLQGYIETDPAVLAEIGDAPAGEARIRFPRRMMQFFPEANGG